MTNNTLEVKLTKHARRRIFERQIKKEIIQKSILSFLFVGDIKNYTAQDEILITNKFHNISLLVTIRQGKIYIITALNKSNCICKEGTLLVAV